MSKPPVHDDCDDELRKLIVPKKIVRSKLTQAVSNMKQLCSEPKPQKMVKWINSNMKNENQSNKYFYLQFDKNENRRDARIDILTCCWITSVLAVNLNISGYIQPFKKPDAVDRWRCVSFMRLAGVFTQKNFGT